MDFGIIFFCSSQCACELQIYSTNNNIIAFTIFIVYTYNDRSNRFYASSALINSSFQKKPSIGIIQILLYGVFIEHFHRSLLYIHFDQ